MQSRTGDTHTQHGNVSQERFPQNTNFISGRRDHTSTRVNFTEEQYRDNRREPSPHPPRDTMAWRQGQSDYQRTSSPLSNLKQTERYPASGNTTLHILNT